MAKTFDNKDVSYNKGKSYNLSKKQLAKAGASKAAKRTVDISKTRRATSGPNKGRTLGPAGKPLNGTVTLPSGVKAVYKDGKRVTVRKQAPAKPAARPARPAPSGSSRSAPPRSTPPRSTPPATGPKDKGKDKGKAKPSVVMGKTYTTRTQTNPQAGRTPSTNGQVPSASRTYSNGAASSPSASKPKSWHEQGGGGLAGPNSPLRGKGSGIRVGETRNLGPNNEPHRWDGSKFVPVSGSRAPKPSSTPASKPKTKVVYVNNQATVADLQPDGTYKPRPRR